MKVKHLILFLLIFLLTALTLVKEVTKENVIYQENYKSKNTINNLLSIMLETSPKTGDYKVSDDANWPDDNFVYNKYLSYCDNGSKLLWNETTRSITLSSTLTEKCYIYFDIYILPTIDSISISTTESNIIVTPNITEGDYPVSNIIYKIDEQNEIETKEKSYEFNSLSNKTKHTIIIYAKDSNNKKSNVYSYTLPNIKNVLFKTTLSSIEITLEKEKGTEEISKYYYSIDNGKTFIETNDNIYTFANLNENTTYNLKIYTIDKNNIKSMYYIDNIKTKSRPTTPNINFDSNYNIILSGSTSENGAVEYFYSTDNQNFTKSNKITLTSSATIYAYAIDSEGFKSNTVSKNVTITNSSNGTVSTSYYCNKTNSYQTSSTCTYSVSATKTTDMVCSNGSYNSSVGYCTGSYGISRSWTWRDCELTCSSDVHGGYPYTCEYNDRTDGYYCVFNYGAPTYNTTYSCPNGGTLSGANCIGLTYTGTLKYKCSVNNTYYDNNSSATTACANYCQVGTYYNSKCYKLS